MIPQPQLEQKGHKVKVDMVQVEIIVGFLRTHQTKDKALKNSTYDYQKDVRFLVDKSSAREMIVLEHRLASNYLMKS